MTPEQQFALLATPVGRAVLGFDAEFARTFNPEGWIASKLERASGGRPRGSPCFRKGKQVIHELPDGYEADSHGQVRKAVLRSHVDVPARSEPQEDIRSAANHYHGANGLPLMTPGGHTTTLGLEANTHVANMPIRSQRLILAAAVRPFASTLPPEYQAALESVAGHADRVHGMDIPGSVHAQAVTGMDRAYRDISRHQATRFGNDSPRDSLLGNMIRAALDADRGNSLHSGGTFRAVQSVAALHHRFNDQGQLDVTTNRIRPDDPRLIAAVRRTNDLIRSVVGDPYASHRIPLNPTIRSLAHGAYASDDQAHLAPLSDALEEAGADEYTLSSLRNPHAAVRCHWVVDHILGKRST